MAKVSIYVPDELRARMIEAGDQVNWSEIARPAFEHALANLKHRRSQNMDTAIERLRASKAKHIQSLSENGYNDGYSWAKNAGEFEHLVAIADFDDHCEGLETSDILSMLKDAVDPDDMMSTPEFLEMMFGVSTFPHQEAYAVKFIEGVQAFYEEVKGQI